MASIEWSMDEELIEYAPVAHASVARRIVLVFGALIALVFAYTVWPTPYAYEHDADHLVRIHRLTHDVEVYSLGGWHSAAPADSAAIRALRAKYGLEP